MKEMKEYSGSPASSGFVMPSSGIMLVSMKNLNERKVLDIIMPEITSYPIYAHFLAIMQVHSETREWLLSNFLQICSNSNVLNFYDFNYTCSPFLRVQKIGKTLLKDWNIDIMYFICKSISDGHYVYMLVKKRCIPAYGISNPAIDELNEAVHNILIYGYDIQKEIFYIADNFANGTYAFSECSFTDMKKAITYMRQEDENKGEFQNTIELIQYQGEFRPNLSVRRIYEGIFDYYECRPTGMWNIMHVNNYDRNKKWYFGQECYAYIEKKIRESDFLWIQDFHLLWEHKVHLKSVLEYLVEKKYIENDTIVLEMNAIAQKALVARNLILKHNITRQTSVKKRAIEQYKNIRDEESKLIYKILKQLESCNMERLMYLSDK